MKREPLRLSWWPWPLVALTLGSLAGIAIPIVALNFYVNIAHPHALVAALAVSVGILIWLLRGNRPDRFPIALASSLGCAVGAYGLMYLMLSVYPPNIS